MAVAVIALLVGVSGAATATVLVTGRQIKDGTISRADLTPKLRASVDRAGPRGLVGATGPAGPAGAKGDTGAPGPSEAAVGFTGSGSLSGGTPGPNALVSGLSVPAGSYVIQANVVLTNPSAGGVIVDCRILAGAETADVASTTLDAAGGLDTQTLSLAGAATLGLSVNNVGLLCSGPVDYLDADVITTRVGALR
jgi:hypothetical protein